MRAGSTAVCGGPRDIEVECRTPRPEGPVGMVIANSFVEEAGWIVLASGPVGELDDYTACNQRLFVECLTCSKAYLN